MSFDEIKQSSTDVNGNLQYIDPMFYLLNFDGDAMNIRDIFSSFIGEQKKIDAIVNEKYAQAKEIEPQTVNGSGMMPPYMRPNIGLAQPTGLPPGLRQQYMSHHSKSPLVLSSGPPQLKKFSFH
jgi:hypothetical protein